MTRDEKFQVSLIGGGVMLFHCLGFFFAPASKLGVDCFQNKISLMLVIVGWLPAIVLISMILGLLFAPKKLIELCNSLTPRIILTIVTYYSFWVVLWTGGFHVSPFAPLVPIIPLLASPMLTSDKKSSFLKNVGLGILIVATLSSIRYFQPPAEYPSGGSWDFSGKGTIIIATVVVLGGLAVEHVGFRCKDVPLPANNPVSIPEEETVSAC